MQERLFRLDVNIQELERFRHPGYTPRSSFGMGATLWPIGSHSDRHRPELLPGQREKPGLPSTYAKCVDLLRRARILDDHLSSLISGMVGLRNILVHEDISKDSGRLYDLLDRLDDCRLFAKQIHPYISTMPGDGN
jgi:hypothetical protein